MLRQNLFSKVIFLITSFIFVFFIFDTWELSFKDYQSLESQLESRIQKADELRSEINFIQEKIEDLEDPEKLDIILRQHGYGLPGENIYRFKFQSLLPLLKKLFNVKGVKVFWSLL